MKIALIAGETSGDQLGGWLIEALKKRMPGVRYMGLGGPRMQAQGLTTLFPMEDISLIGFTEVLPHYFSIKERLIRMVKYIEQEKPDILITIDSMGFNHRVVKLLRDRGIHRPRLIHYVAPSVWAYRPKRAAILAELYDELYCLLPFEPPYFETAGLPATFVGHEIAWYWRKRGDGAAFRQRHGISADIPLLALFPGSRRGELKRMMPMFRDTIAQLRGDLPELEVAVMVPDYLKDRLAEEVKNWGLPVHLLTSNEEKRDLFAAATAGLAKSGTIGLECALAGLPSVITYRANPITVAILRRIIRVKYVNLANLLAGRMVIPELLQEDATPTKLSVALKPLLLGGHAHEVQLQALTDIAAQLGAADSISPSDKMATRILG